MVGEFKLILTPVDAEMGRGAGQVQVVTKSGGNAYHGSGVWSNQNTALDANEWDEHIGERRCGKNVNQYTHKRRWADHQEQDVLLCLLGSQCP